MFRFVIEKFCLSIEQKVDRKNHIISANEGSAMGIAAGYHLATNKIIYLQNSGFGNIINPLLSIDKGIFNTSCHFNGLERQIK